MSMKTFRLSLILFLTLVVCVGNSYAQEPFKAVPDNFFVTPNSSEALLNILRNDELGTCDTAHIQFEITEYPKYGVLDDANNPVKYTPNPGFIGQDIMKYRINCGGNLSNETIVLINMFDQPNSVILDACTMRPQGIDFEVKQMAASEDLGVSSMTTPLVGDMDGDGIPEIIVLSHPFTTGNYTGTSLPYYDGIRFYNLVKSPVTGNDTLVIKYYIDLKIANEDTGKVFPYPYGNLAIANVDGGTTSAVFFTDGLGRLTKYVLSGGSFVAQATVNYSSGNNYYLSAVPLVADLMADGNVQVICFDKIYNAKDLTLLVDAGFIPTNNTLSTQYHFGMGMHWSKRLGDGVNNYYHASSLLVVDIDNDGILELAGGACVYDVHLENYAGTAGNTYNLRLDIRNNPANSSRLPFINDGGTAVADIDLDGFMDIVVASLNNNTNEASLYVYNPRTGNLLTNNIISNIPTNPTYPGLGPSLPFIGDLDGDGYPEIALTAYLVLQAYKYNDATSQLDLMWSLPNTDTSSSTTLSLFDFTQSGISQLIYRDEYALRIIDGRKYDENGVLIPNTDAARTLETFAGVHSPTINEYPIVADVNNDGAAEIIVTGSPFPFVPGGFNGKVYVFGAAGTEKWAPARPVWNQNAYNPAYINDDLTLPQYPVNPVTTSIDRYGNIYRPFNNFLQQSSLLNDEGLMFVYAPDLAFDKREGTENGATIIENGQDYDVDIWVLNQGDAEFHSPLLVSVYGFTGSTFVKLAIEPASFAIPNGNLEVGDTQKFTFTIKNAVSEFPNTGFIQIRLNELGEYVFPASPTQAECLYWNNFEPATLYGIPNQVLCEGPGELKVFPPNSPLTFVWFDDPVSEDDAHYIGTGKVMSFIKDGSAVQTLYVDVYNGPIQLSSREEVNIYLTPDSLIWTGAAGNTDWNDYRNWYDPKEATPYFYPESKVPRACTDVLIPDYPGVAGIGLVNIYPDLNRDSTTRTIYYPDASCNNIWFLHGGEVVRTDLLNYNKAHVELRLGTDRWYMLSTPLRYMYAGDYWRDSRCPWEDKLQVYTQLFGMENPQDVPHGYVGPTPEDLNPTGDWSGPFHNPEVEIPIGFGFAAWLDDETYGGEGFRVGDKQVMWFPKQETHYDIFYRNSCRVWERDIPLSRTQAVINDSLHHRFVYEINNPGMSYRKPKTGAVASSGIITLANTPPPSQSKLPMRELDLEVGFHPIIVGNPFMSHWDFNEFEAQNSELIGDSYWLLDNEGTDDGAFQIYNKVISINDTLIAPMQSIIVSAVSDEIKANSLKTKFTSMRQKPGVDNKLRSAGSNIKPNLLKVIAEKDGKQNPTYLLFDAQATNSYKWREDSHKLFVASVKEPVAVYSRSSDDFALDINTFGDCAKMISLGVRTSTTGTINLHFEGIENFVSKYDVFLIDMEDNEEINLRETPFYCFEKTTKELFMDNRLYLSFVDKVTGMKLAKPVSTSIFMKGSQLQVTSISNIKQVRIIDMQGKTLINEANINSRVYTRNLEFSGVYIVKVLTESELVVNKVIKN